MLQKNGIFFKLRNICTTIHLTYYIPPHINYILITVLNDYYTLPYVNYILIAVLFDCPNHTICYILNIYA